MADKDYTEDQAGEDSKEEKTVETPDEVLPPEGDKNDVPESTETPEDSETTALVTEVEPTFAIPTVNLEGSGYVGEYDDSDFSLNKLHVAQKIGELGEEFEPGSLVFNLEEMFLEWDKKEKKAPSTHCVIWACQKFYHQYISWKDQQASGETPKTYRTKQEVIDNGGGFVKDHPDRYMPAVRLLLLVKALDNEDCPLEIFDQQIDGDRWAIASMVLRVTLYYSTGTKIGQLSKKKDTEGNPIHLAKHLQELSITSTPIDGNTIYIPKFTVIGQTSTEMLNMIAEVGV